MSAERVALEGAPFPGKWRTQGACRHVPLSLFFPSRGEQVGSARSVCAGCPVVEECRAYAVGVPGLKGVWAGLSEGERKDLRHEAEAAPEDEETPRPPPAASASPAGILLAHLEQLVAYQGQGARVARFSSTHSASSLASLLRGGQRPTPPGRWQFVGHADDQGSELWARYQGSDKA